MEYPLKVAPCGGRIQDGQTKLLLVVHHENGATGEGNALGIDLVLVQHIKLERQFPLVVRNDGIVKGAQLCEQKRQLEAIPVQKSVTKPTAKALDVLDPTLVRLHCVAGQCNWLDSTLLEFRNQCRHPGQFRGANRRKIRRMGEQNGPAVLHPVVEIDSTLAGLSREVWELIANV